MAPFGRAGWRNASSAEAAFGSFPVYSAGVSTNKNLEWRPAHPVVLVLLIPILSTVARSKVYTISRTLLVKDS